MTRKPQTIRFWRGRLPHWEVVDGRYFITLRLANSLPRRKAEELREHLCKASEADYLVRARVYFKQMEYWLDRNEGHTWLAQPEVADAISEAVDHYGRIGRWHVAAGTIMPNHLHLFLRCGDGSLTDLMRGFKRLTSRACNELLCRQGKRIWQVEWFDHWSRSPQEDDRIVAYIRNNPVKAGLAREPGDWPYSW